MGKRAPVLLLAIVTAAGTMSVTSAQAAPVGNLLAGTVMNGSIPESNASVVATVWPNSRTLAALADEADVPTRDIDTTTTDSNGNYALNGDLASLPSQYKEANGGFSVEVSVDGASAEQTYNLPMTARVPQRLTFNTSTKQAQVNSDPAEPVATQPRPASSNSSKAAAAGRQCTAGKWKAATKYTGRKEHFLNLYVDDGIYGHVVETVKAEHSLGIGVAYSGSGWGGSGSASVTTESAAKADVLFRSSRQLSNAVNYRNFKTKCVYSPGYKYQSRPTGFDALMVPKYESAISTNHYSHCYRYDKGSYQKVRGANTTFSVGIELGFVSLSAHASYSTEVSVTYGFGTASDSIRGSLCGSNAGWASATTASAYNNLSSPGCGPTGPCAVKN